MADNYKLYSLIQGIFITLCSISVLDFSLLIFNLLSADSEDFGFNEALFDNSDTVWWSVFMFWAYCFYVVSGFQFLKGLSHDPKDLARYKMLTLIQSVAIFLVGLTTMDYALLLDFDGDDFGIVDGLFDPSNSDNTWWNLNVFWAYCFLLVAILHFLKLGRPRILSLVQAIAILIAGISLLDGGLGQDDFGFNETLFEDSTTGWWFAYALWAYCFFVVAITQFIKAVNND